MKFALILIFSSGALAQTPAIADISLHDTKATVQAKLRSRATFQREEEGQQIFELHAGSIKNLIVGYDANNKVRYVTALGNHVSCEVLGPAPKTVGKPPDLIFQRTLDSFLVIAHGTNPSHLTSCSIKDPNATIPDEDDEGKSHP